MVAKVNGTPKEGFWAEKDVSYLRVVSTATPFAIPFTVDGFAEKVVRVLQTRGTVIAISRETNATAHFIFGHAGGAFTSAVLTQLKADLDALGAGTFTLTLGTKFTVV